MHEVPVDGLVVRQHQHLAAFAASGPGARVCDDCLSALFNAAGERRSRTSGPSFRTSPRRPLNSAVRISQGRARPSAPLSPAEGVRLPSPSVNQ
jgi:hypothetical protein